VKKKINPTRERSSKPKKSRRKTEPRRESLPNSRTNFTTTTTIIIIRHEFKRPTLKKNVRKLMGPS
jgi:hypothetical protein